MQRSAVEVVAARVRNASQHGDKKNFRYNPHGLVNILFFPQNHLGNVRYFLCEIFWFRGSTIPPGRGYMFFGLVFFFFFDYLTT